MKTQTKRLLLAAKKYCDINDKSTEFMLQYMQDVADVDLDCVISFLTQLGNSPKAGRQNLLKTKPNNEQSKKG